MYEREILGGFRLNNLTKITLPRLNLFRINEVMFSSPMVQSQGTLDTEEEMHKLAIIGCTRRGSYSAKGRVSAF